MIWTQDAGTGNFVSHRISAVVGELQLIKEKLHVGILEAASGIFGLEST